MMNTKMLLVAIGMMLIVTVGRTQNPSKNNSLLYVVSGNSLTKPVYIYGTIHSICPELVYWPATIDSILFSVDKVYFEVDIKKMKRLYIVKDNLAQADSFAKINDKERIQQAILTLNPYCFNSVSYEAIILNKIDSLGIPSSGLESIGSQVFLFNKIYDERYNVEFPNELNLTAGTNLLSAYLTQDVDWLYRCMYQAMSFEQGRILLDNRNRNWVLRFKQVVKDKSVFIAVGAGHLGGNSGVLKLLEKKGYTVTAVAY